MRISEVGRKISFVLLIGLSLAIGFLTGHFYGTGTFPVSTSQPYTMPTIVDVTTLEARSTLEPLTDKEYDEGYTCVDFAWEAMRLMRWQGYEALIVILELDPGPNHALLLVPTVDDGWIFLDPQCGGCPLKPHVGGKYFNHTIVEIYVLQFDLVPIEEFFSGPYES